MLTGVRRNAKPFSMAATTSAQDAEKRECPHHVHGTSAVKAKLHYAILVADRFEAGRRRAIARDRWLLAS